MGVQWDCAPAIYRFQDSLEVLYNTVIEFGIPRNLVRLIKMCLNETYSKICTGKYLSGAFPIQNGLKQEMLYHHCFRICHQESPGK
jgi:hypothetical protein